MQTDGTVIDLDGAEEPFVTREEESTNPATPIRTQTGTIRVYDPDGTTLEQLMPATSTERMVQLVSGSWQGSVFTDGAVCWQGFIKAGAYTQGWEGGRDTIELPVISMLSALEYVRMSPSGNLGICHLSELVVEAADALGVEPWTQVSVISDIEQSACMFGYLRGIRRTWISSETVQGDGDQHVVVEGETWAKILSDVVSLFGLQLREDGQTLYAAQYDAGEGCVLKRSNYTWTEWTRIADGIKPQKSVTDIPSSSLMAVAQWAGTGHRQSYEPGKQKARVVLKLDSGGDAVLALPETADNRQGYNTILLEDDQRLLVQQNPPRVGGVEGFAYSEVDGTTHDYIGPSDYMTCLQYSGIFTPDRDPELDGGSLYTGAFPVRWALTTQGQQPSGLLSGLWMVQFYEQPQSPRPIWYMYQIESPGSEYFDNGYLDIQATMYALWAERISATQTKLRIVSSPNQYNYQWVQAIMVSLVVGDYIWNNTTKSWVLRGINDPRMFAWDLVFDGEMVAPQATMSTPVRDSVGWLIPVNGISGKVTLYIFNASYTYKTLALCSGTYNHLLKDLRIDYRPVSTISDSTRTENVYLQTISGGQENEEASVELTIGTNNNNIGSNQFLRRENTMGYQVHLAYEAQGGSVISERPENHLLARLAAYYSETRRSMDATIDTGLDIFGRLYTYGGRTYYAIDMNHEWREDRQQIKLIET